MSEIFKINGDDAKSIETKNSITRSDVKEIVNNSIDAAAKAVADRFNTVSQEICEIKHRANDNDVKMRGMEIQLVEKAINLFEKLNIGFSLDIDEISFEPGLSGEPRFSAKGVHISTSSKANSEKTTEKKKK